MIFKDDPSLFKTMRQYLFTAVVGDIMDQLGFTHQFLSPAIRPLRDDMVIVGRAMPVQEVDIYDSNREMAEKKPFGLMLEALDDLKENEVYLASGGDVPYALWGELMSYRARKLGAAGAVLDGYSRDTPGILKLNFPTFSHGSYAQDQAPRGTVVDFRTRIIIGNVEINPGDIVFGDIDGVCVIPKSIEEEVITKAIEKASGEKTVQQAIENGMSTVEAFKTFGIM
jgi:regulator of RNase E activity RraA